MAYLGLLVLVLAYWLYTPVPEGYTGSQVSEIMFTHACFKILINIAWLSDRLGVGTNNMATISAMRHKKLTESEMQHPFAQMTDMIFEGVSMRVYTPRGPAGHDQDGGADRPGIVYIHGGGWVINSIDTYHSFVSELCGRTGAVIVSVSYRLAPEWVYPAGQDDCLDVTKYFLRHARQFRVDPQRVAIMGDSAGGNLATTVAIRLRDDSFSPKLKAQVLLYPVTQIIDFKLPSMMTHAHGPILTRTVMATFACLYLMGNWSLGNRFHDNIHISTVVRQNLMQTFLNVDRLPAEYRKGYSRQVFDRWGDDEIWNKVKDKILSPYVSPLIASDLRELPQTFLMTCEHDILRDEGLLYGYRLTEAGNEVVYYHVDKGFHGMLLMDLDWAVVQDTFNNIVKCIQENV